MLEEKTRVLPETSMSAVETEKLGQLSAGKEKRHAGFEAGHNTLRDEMYHDSGFREPGNECDERDQYRSAGREGAKAHSIPARNFPKRRADHERDRGGDRDRSLPRAAENPKNQAAEQTGVQASFRRQVSKRRVAQSCGKQIRGKRDAGEKIQAKPVAMVIAQPFGGGKGSFPPGLIVWRHELSWKSRSR